MVAIASEARRASEGFPSLVDDDRMTFGEPQPPDFRCSAWRGGGWVSWREKAF